MLELRTEASVGVEWFQAKGAACTNALQREEAKYISRAKTSQVKLEGKDNHNTFSLTIELEKNFGDQNVINPLTLQVLQTRPEHQFSHLCTKYSLPLDVAQLLEEKIQVLNNAKQQII